MTMTEETSAQDPLAMRVGKSTVRANLDASVAQGRLILQADGKFALPQGGKPGASPWLRLNRGAKKYDRPSCTFLTDFLFYEAYARTTVPFGCRECYKVKIVPRTLKELIALLGVMKRIDCSGKCGTEVTHQYSQNAYAGFFYAEGLEHARAVYRETRSAVDAQPDLGPEVPMLIKRGCTLFEVLCGPSDRYRFPPGMAAVEALLRDRCVVPEKPATDNEFITKMRWFGTAFSIGDDTYLEFTGGKRVYPPIVTYSP